MSVDDENTPDSRLFGGVFRVYCVCRWALVLNKPFRFGEAGWLGVHCALNPTPHPTRSLRTYCLASSTYFNSFFSLLLIASSFCTFNQSVTVLHTLVSHSLCLPTNLLPAWRPSSQNTCHRSLPPWPASLSQTGIPSTTPRSLTSQTSPSQRRTGTSMSTGLTSS